MLALGEMSELRLCSAARDVFEAFVRCSCPAGPRVRNEDGLGVMKVKAACLPSSPLLLHFGVPISSLEPDKPQRGMIIVI